MLLILRLIPCIPFIPVNSPLAVKARNLCIYRDKEDERDNSQTNNLLNADQIGDLPPALRPPSPATFRPDHPSRIFRSLTATAGLPT